VKIFLLLILNIFLLDAMCQHNSIQSTAGVNIISPNDTSEFKANIIYEPKIIKSGLTPKETINIIGYPKEKIKIGSEKEKWIYDKYYIYFFNSEIDIIIKLAIDTLEIRKI